MIRTCAHCGSEFRRSQSTFKARNLRHCSMACKKADTRLAAAEKAKPLTAERLRSLLDYDPESGVFRWKQKTSNQTNVGDIADRITEGGYRRISIFYKKYLSHRLAWLYVYGEDRPLVEHINRDPSDNRIANLRLGSKAENGWNRGANKNNSSGFKGVDLVRGRWRARIVVLGKTVHMGYFSTRRDAAVAYNEAALRFHGEFACLNELDQEAPAES